MRKRVFVGSALFIAAVLPGTSLFGQGTPAPPPVRGIPMLGGGQAASSQPRPAFPVAGKHVPLSGDARAKAFAELKRQQAAPPPTPPATSSSSAPAPAPTPSSTPAPAPAADAPYVTITLTPTTPIVGKSKVTGFVTNPQTNATSRFDAAQWILGAGTSINQLSGYVDLEFETAVNKLYLLDCTIYSPYSHSLTFSFTPSGKPTTTVTTNGPKVAVTLGLTSSSNPTKIGVGAYRDFWGFAPAISSYERVWAFEGCTLHAVQ